MNLKDSIKGGRTEVFRMYCCVEDPEYQEIKYLDLNSSYPYVMSETEFPVGHPEIRRGHKSCKNLIDKLKMKGEKFGGLCQVKILPLMDYLCLVWLINWTENYCFMVVEMVQN